MARRWTITLAVLMLATGWALSASAAEEDPQPSVADDAVAQSDASAPAADAAAPAADAAATAVAEDEASTAAGVSETADPADKDEDDKGWGVNAGTSISLGTGAFAANDYVRRTRSRLGFTFGANYTIPVVDVGVSVGTGFSQWLTRGGGSQTPQEFRWSDTDLGFSRSIYTIPVVDLAISGELGFTLPTSTFSQAAGLYTTISPGLSLSSKFGPVGLSYSIGYSHNFYKFTSVTFDPTEVDILSRNGGTEILDAGDLVAEGGVLTEMSLGHNFGISYSFLEDFRFSVGFGFSDAWTFDNGTIAQDDAFTSPYADASRGHSQATHGSVGLSYSPIKYLSMNLGMSSSQPWKTADNKGYRFPFFDFESTASNFTNFRFGLSANY